MAQNPALHDTPHKFGATINIIRNKPVMAEIKDTVAKEIKNKLHLLDIEEFMRFFPEDSQASQRLNTLMENGIYSDSRWQPFPETFQGEKALYEPFARVANAIVATIPADQIQTEIYYVNIHDRVPLSLEDDLADGLPDGAGVSRNREMVQLAAEIHELEKERNSNAPENPAFDRNMRELRNKYSVWWMHFHVSYDIKPVTPAHKIGSIEWYNRLYQILAYMRLMLIEQLDRRFVLGFLLCGLDLTLIMCDRSGVVMAKQPINIHQDPERFIRVISGFSRMSPAQLGWDTSMKIYQPKLGIRIPSYEIGNAFEGVYGEGRYHIHWVITLVDDGKEMEYVTVSIVSAIRSAEICSRATIVFEVVDFKEKENPKETFALKRYWRPIEQEDTDMYPSEGDLYKFLDAARGSASDFPRYAYVANDIKIDGETDSTFKLIRRGLMGQRYDRPTKPLPAKKRFTRSETGADAEIRSNVRDVPQNHLLPQPIPSTLEFVDRHHGEILMPMGETIKSFCSITELLTCFVGFVNDHEFSHDNQILHRDVSMGNLLIFKGPDGKTIGRLMDYDHAKRALAQLLIKPPYENESPENFETRKKHLVYLLSRGRLPWKVDDDVLSAALKWVDLEEHAQNYIAGAVQIAKADTDCSQKTYTASDLGWEHLDLPKAMTWPNWEGRPHRKGERTVRSYPTNNTYNNADSSLNLKGTLPYMSAEVLYRSTIVDPVGCEETPPFTHQAIHDMESLLWVLVRLCLTRKGPGVNMRRDDELDFSSPTYKPALVECLRNCFDGDEGAIKQYKMWLLQKSNSKKFADEIVAHFHPYFEPLKPYVIKWWSILMLGYKYRADEFYHIHGHIRRLLQRAIDEIQPNEDVNGDATQAALRAREDHKNSRLTTFCPKDETMASGTPPRSPLPSRTTLTHDVPPLARIGATEHSSHSSCSWKPPTAKKPKRS
ncbi:hypothetical protein H0H93_006238 [Arthromyces matolae]|nr:hypothetical protein H0H93_006238 [Arthromyces matolae]